MWVCYKSGWESVYNTWLVGAVARINGLGPTVASIVYFLHPAIVPPLNTAMVNGFNVLFGDREKLGVVSRRHL